MPTFWRRKEEPWEVVENKTVDPVPMYYDDELEDLDIVRVGEVDTCGTYVFDVKSLPEREGTKFRNALLFARQQLLQEVAKKGFNILLLESWTLTHFRRGKQHRVEVRYTGRPAYAMGKPLSRLPPYIALLEGNNMPPTP